MHLLVENPNLSLSLALTGLRLVGFWPPEGLAGTTRTAYDVYAAFSFTVLLGIFLLAQTIDLFVIWGDIPLMTATAFLLFTNLAQATKFINIAVRGDRIRALVDDGSRVLKAVETEEARNIVINCDKQTRLQLISFFTLTLVTITGFATSAESGNLPLRAWYPYDTTKSPAYELTYAHQVYALFVAAFLNVAKDTVVTSLLAQCHCRLQLLALSLRTLCRDLPVQGVGLLSPQQEKTLVSRIRRCVVHHQSALEAATQMQLYFSEPTFAQFNVSLVIICVTAFQLVSQSGNMVRLASMCTYLVNMMFQVFLYCYQGNQLSEESSEIAGAAYLSPWYVMSPARRRDILFIMTRSRRIARITAGGFTTLSLASFMAIIKASYSLFTLLKQVDEKCLYITVQAAELISVFGDVSAMTSAGFLLFTNIVLFIKMINVMMRRDQIHEMVDDMDKKLRDVKDDDEIAVVKSVDRLTTWQLYIFTFLSLNVVFGLAASVEKPLLPLPARYPFDATVSPAFEITYLHQSTALILSAIVNISLDTLVTSLTAQCYCRFRLLALSLTKLCQNLKVNAKMMLSEDDEKIVLLRLRACVKEHQAILLKAVQIQKNFSMPIFYQLTVSSFIICVTAYQLAFEEMQFVRLWSLLAYLTVMMLQVFLYCYHGNELTIQSTEISAAAYECPWYVCSRTLRRNLLMLMIRSVRVVCITAGGITNLSLGTFMRVRIYIHTYNHIIKASYSFFTVLQTVQE
ncbi:odorant receptor Or1 [Amyelois transitella]|uniref:odorant receptor Or1 n=1 Tax=Amyelois transitella TaxID=680683 RepID=UPI0029905CBF|nr:odorant receptor Or1 [Amyelois transitella]